MNIQKQKFEEIGTRNRKTNMHTVKIDKPYFRSERSHSKTQSKVGAIINAANDPIAIMHKKGHITDAQKKAADKFYNCYVISLGGTNMGLDYRRQKVDGGRFNSYEPIKPIEAEQELLAARSALGYCYELVELVAGRGNSISHLTNNKQRQNILGHNLRDSLDVLASLWGYTLKKHIFIS